jgi:hypothetical protein
LLHRAAPGAVRIRVAGQRLHDLLRIDPRGMSIGSLFSAAARDTVMDLVDTAFEGPTIVGLPMTASRGLGREPMPAELLPMMDAPQGKSRGLWAHWSLPTRWATAPTALISQAMPCCVMTRWTCSFAERRGTRSHPVPGEKLVLQLVVNNSWVEKRFSLQLVG